MASAIPVHSPRKGKQVNEESVKQAGGPVQSPEGQVPESVQSVGPQGVKLESHDAYRVDY